MSTYSKLGSPARCAPQAEPPQDEDGDRPREIQDGYNWILRDTKKKNEDYGDMMMVLNMVKKRVSNMVTR
jgi:hypothetical protein